jgi:protein SCO1/2
MEDIVRNEFARQPRLTVGIDRSPASFPARLLAIALACLGALVACGPRTAQLADTGAKVNSEARSTAVKRYPLTGRVVSIDKPNQSMNVDGDRIPGFMAAMTMPYPLKDASVLEKVLPGDQIKAEIVVGNQGAYLENVVVVTRTPSQSPRQ